MIGYAERYVVTDTLNLTAGGTKEYVISNLNDVYVYGYTHNLQDGYVSIVVKKNDSDAKSVCLAGSDCWCVIPVTSVDSENGIKIILTANQNLSNVSFVFVFYYGLN